MPKRADISPNESNLVFSLKTEFADAEKNGVSGAIELLLKNPSLVRIEGLHEEILGALGFNEEEQERITKLASDTLDGWSNQKTNKPLNDETKTALINELLITHLLAILSDEELMAVGMGQHEHT